MVESNGQVSANTLHTLAWTTITQALAGMGITGTSLQPRLAAALGWKPELTALDYYAKYRRQELAQRIIDIYADYTWRVAPRITDDRQADPVTPFEAAYLALEARLGLPMVWQQLDRLMGLGHYAVLLLGTDDGQPLSQPVRRARTLTYVSPYGEMWADILALDARQDSERFGKPDTYRLDLGRSRARGDALLVRGVAPLLQEQVVHWSRLIHVTENSFDGGTIGTPRLRSLYNALDDLTLLLGASTLMFYKAGIGRYVAALREGAQVPVGEDREELERQFEEFIADIRQLIRVQGIDMSVLESSIASPKEQIDAHKELLAAGAGIPQRILYGSERGELSSTQDQTDWETTITSRQQNVMTQLFVRQTIDRLLAVGILPTPAGGQYEVIWPPSRSTNPSRQAEIAERMGRAIAAYIDGQGELVVPVGEFRERYLGLEASPEGGFPEEELDREDEQEDEPPADEDEEDAA